MSKEKYTIGEVLNMLHTTARATHIDGGATLIKGNAKLEKEQSEDIKSLEDILVESMAADGITYTRQYEHLYKDL